MDIYTSRGTIESCVWSGHRFHVLEPLKSVKIGTMIILPFPVEHDAPEPFGYLIESALTGDKLLYLTDSFFCRYKFRGISHAMLECNYDTATLHRNIAAGIVPAELAARLAKSHMSLDTLLKMLAANDCSRLKQIYLIHLSDRNSDAELMKREVQRATGAEVYVANDVIADSMRPI